MRTVQRRNGTTDSMASIISLAIVRVEMGPTEIPFAEGTFVTTSRGHSSSVVRRT